MKTELAPMWPKKSVNWTGYAAKMTVWMRISLNDVEFYMAESLRAIADQNYALKHGWHGAYLSACPRGGSGLSPTGDKLRLLCSG